MAKAPKRRSPKQPANATARPRKAAAKVQAKKKPSPRPSKPRVLRPRSTRSTRDPAAPSPPPSPSKLQNLRNPLDTLPNELLYGISDHLSDRDLAAACTASKQFYNLLYPLLYRRLQTATIYWPRCRNYPWVVHDTGAHQITALQWAAGKGLSRLLARLIEDAPEDSKKDLWSPWKYSGGGGQHLLAYGADSGDEETMKLLLRVAEKMGADDEHIIGCGALYRCKGFRVFSILSEEGARRMRLAMRRRGKKTA
jgi:hypothetical protein